MKKLLLTFLAVLGAIAVILSLLDLNGDYTAERDLWNINREFAAMAKHEDSTPADAIELLANKYRAFVLKYPKTNLAARAQMMVGNVYLFKKDYNRARAEFKKVAFISTEDKDLLAQAQTSVAGSFETQGDWNDALSVYKDIIQEYPLTAWGFTTPLLISKYYESRGLQANADAAYEEAVLFYQNVADKNPKSILEYNALRFKTFCRLSQKKWAPAVQAMRELMLKYPTQDAMGQAIKTINVVCVTQMRDYNLAIGIYKEYVRKYPKSPFEPVLEKMISSLETLKKNDVHVSATP